MAQRLSPRDCILSTTDSLVSNFLLQTSNFDEDFTNAHSNVDPVEADVRLEVHRYNQAFPGKENDISNALSRDDNRSDDEGTHVLLTFVPQQMPEQFKIVPLPNKFVL